MEDLNKVYKPFNSYILRTPVLSLNFYKKLTSSKGAIPDEVYKKICTDKLFKEAIFLASPELSETIDRWVVGNLSENNIYRLKNTVLKYITRMSSRSTPFGLFAGCSVGHISETIDINLKPKKNHKRHTRLDMNYLSSLSENLTNLKEVKEKVLFYSNSSIYFTAREIRMIQYSNINGERKYFIISTEKSEHILRILKNAKKGATLEKLALSIVDDQISYKESIEFIFELISNQLLVSDLEPSITGQDYTKQIVSILKSKNLCLEKQELLGSIQKQLSTIDLNIGNKLSLYNSVIKNVKKLGANFDSKFLFQNNLIFAYNKNTLSKKIIKDILSGFNFLNKISQSSDNKLLKDFTEAFYERYEDEEIQLVKALDVDIGIGYKQLKYSGAINHLIDDLTLPQKRTANPSKLIWDEKLDFFNSKIIEAYRKNSTKIILTDNDIKNFPSQQINDLPDTISFLVNIIGKKNNEKIVMNYGGGSSAGILSSRFSYSDREINLHVREILDIEKKINHGKILAEIVHLPEARLGNVISRNVNRDYEIPYLAKSSKGSENQIDISDLYISVRNNKIKLRSKKLDKEIIPRLTCAHNYSKNSLPIYHFLCDIQTQNHRRDIGVKLGFLSKQFSFIPRIEYKNIIITPASWNLKNSQIKKILLTNNDDNLKKEVKYLLKEFKIPQFVYYVNGDNKLLINFNNIDSIKMFLKEVKNLTEFTISEFLFNENDEIVQSEGNSYTNEFVISFFNNKKLN